MVVIMQKHANMEMAARHNRASEWKNNGYRKKKEAESKRFQHNGDF